MMTFRHRVQFKAGAADDVSEPRAVATGSSRYYELGRDLLSFYLLSF